MVTLGHYGFALFICILISIMMVLYNYLFSDMKRQKKLLDEKENKLLRLYQSVEDALDDFNDSVEHSHSEIDSKLKELGALHAEVERSMRGLAAHAPARIERPAAMPQAAMPQPQPAARMPIQQPQFQQQPPAQNIAASIGQAAANIRASAPQTHTPATGPQPRPVTQPQAAPQPQPAPQQAMPQPVVQPPQPQPAAARPQPAPAMAASQAPAQPVASAPQTMAPPPAFRRVMESVGEAAAAAASAAPVGRNETIIAMSNEGKPRSQIAKELGITQSEVDLVIGMNK